MLEAEGWKVWWDTSLTIGDDFRNEIMTELGRARAVIVIWTDAFAWLEEYRLYHRDAVVLSQKTMTRFQRADMV